MIIEQLTAIQTRHGYLPRERLVTLAQQLAVPLFRIEEVASFYPHFRKTPPPEVEIQVCRDMSCALRGSATLLQEVETDLSSEVSAGRVLVRGVSCLGRCDRAPAVRIDHHAAGHSEPQRAALQYLGRTSAAILDAAHGLLQGSHVVSSQTDRDEDHVDRSASWNIDIYAGEAREERYRAVRRVVAALGQNQGGESDAREFVIQQALKNAVLLGMGGAGGQAFKKWCEVKEAAGERKYVVCNADESEPGTFKDREILLRTPHLVVEGVLLAGIVLGAERGYIYIRHEYEACIAAVNVEIQWAREQGLCGKGILDTDIAMEMEVFVSPGGYICGEQTALIQAIEDKRAEPRNRPPELQTNGLWDMPTLVNNVETLAWTPAIVLSDDGQRPVERKKAGTVADRMPANQSCRAGERVAPATERNWYGKQGRPFGELAALILANDADWQRRHGKAQRFPGLRMFSISGDVKRPGVYEVENGISVGELIEQAGGVRSGGRLKAMALSGPSGGFTPAELPRAMWPRRLKNLLPKDLKSVALAELQMHINYFRTWDLMLGAGIVVYDESADLVAQALACLRFFQAESCGKCVHCRIGSTKLAQMGAELAARQLTASEVEALGRERGPVADLSVTMASTAICGLGTVAPNPLTTLLRFFPADVARYLRS